MDDPELAFFFDQARSATRSDLHAIAGAWREAVAMTSDVTGTALLTTVLAKMPKETLAALLAFAVRELALSQEGGEARGGNEGVAQGREVP